jgi:predicted amidohydrolase
VFLDKAATLARAVEAVAEAAGAGAGLVAFPEAFGHYGRPDLFQLQVNRRPQHPYTEA